MSARRTSVWSDAPAGGFCHQALHYRGTDRFFDIVTSYARQGARRGEPVLVMASGDKLAGLRRRLPAEVAASQVELADMDHVGANPARIIPAWRGFVERHPGSERLRGIGEPIGPSRQGAVLDECAHHEELLNVAFGPAAGDDRPFWLLCPYDVAALAPGVVGRSRRNHPFTVDDDSFRHTGSPEFGGVEELCQASSATLAPAPPDAWHLRITGGDTSALQRTRRAVADLARLYGMADATDEVVLAAHEVLTNALAHGDGLVEVAVWREGPTFVCEISDRGELGDVLAGRKEATPNEASGRGLWMVNQLCDLVQLRQVGGRTVVRLHRRQPGRSSAR